MADESDKMKSASEKFDAILAKNGGGADEAAKAEAAPARKDNRALTVAMGKASSTEPDMAALRTAKRAQTLPASSSRRGDLMHSTEVQRELNQMQEALKARIRRGSVSAQFTVVPAEELPKCWVEHTTGHVHGIMTDGQTHSDEREWEFHVMKELPVECPPVLSCQKGSKGFRDTTPNQDNFSITYFKNGWTLACAFDGHGPNGHLVSFRTVQTVPFFLANSPDFPDNMDKALIEAFERSQKDVVGQAVDEGWDVQASGSTAVAACWNGNKVWTANCGDSRVVIGSENTKLLLFETEDHKPDTPKEKERIEQMGGEVRSQTYPDGWVNHRIFVKGEDYPGLCMARTLGDECAKAHGVIATPECKFTEVDLSAKPFMIIASDGIWEFLDSEFVVKACAKKFLSDGVSKTVQKLQREAKKRWKQEEGDYCDDITSICVQLR